MGGRLNLRDAVGSFRGAAIPAAQFRSSNRLGFC